MNVIAKLLALAVIAVSIAAQAGERKETVIDAGRVHIVASVPAAVQGPTRFNGEEGILVLDIPAYKTREAAFGAKLTDLGGGITYKVKVVADSTDPKVFGVKYLTEYMMSTLGQKSKDISPIDPPKVNIPGAQVVAYQFSGARTDKINKHAGYVVAVSIPTAHSGFVYAVEMHAPIAVFDKNAAKFDDIAFAQIMEFKKLSTFEVR